jgi:glycosyltransferase involved in cell wall biosynthesis
MIRNKTVCLNMIVKNESHVIRRCLSSVKHLLDYWVIVDTGSTDGTQEIIKEFMSDLPGELHEQPWVNFAHNRNGALNLARNKADYILFIDADDRLIFADDFVMPELDKDFYYVVQHLNHVNTSIHPNNQVVLLIKDLPDFKWNGVVHEVLSCERGRTFETLSGVFNDYLHDGHRSTDPERFDKDVAMFKKAIEEEPTNSRNFFYLGQTYRGGGTHENFREAIHYYKKRAAMGGRDDEIYYSLYCIAVLERALRFSPEEIIHSLCIAYQYRPFRAEPLFELSGHLIDKEHYFLGYLVSKHALSLSYELDLFVEPWIYDWAILLQFYYCASNLGKYDKANEAFHKLLANANFPEEQRKSIESNQTKIESKKLKTTINL